MKKVILACDLDNTLIHSYKHKKDDDICIEFIKEKEQAKRCTEETVGIVTEIKDDTSIDEDGNLTHTYYPIIQYTAGDRIITKQSSSGSSSSIYHLMIK